MAKLDTGWAASEADRFLPVTALIHLDTGPGITFFDTVMRGPETEASERAHFVCVTDQWPICFGRAGAGAQDVKVVDRH